MSAIDVQNYPYPFFAREGWPFIAISLMVFLALLILDLFFGAFLALILSIFTFQFFRDPKRSGPNDDSVITSPADGRVIFIGKSSICYLSSGSSIHHTQRINITR